MNRIALPARLLDEAVVPVARRVPLAQLRRVCETLSEAGLHVLEVTMDAPDAVAAIGDLAGSVPDVLVGAGTVRNVEDADRAVQAGARFVVSPHTDVEIIQWARDQGVPVVPGAYTPTEVARAWDAGASAVKLFPASVGGVALLQSLRGPFHDVSFIPSGGIDADNAPSWLAAGAAALGVGGWLTGSQDVAVVSARARRLVAAVTESPRDR